MNLTIEQLEAIQHHAGNYMSVAEIAMIIEVEEYDLIKVLKDCDSAPYQRFQKGRILRKSKINANILDLAESGSAAAQTLAMQIISEIAANDLGKNI